MPNTAHKLEDYEAKNKQSRETQSKIVVDSYFAGWRKSDATKTLMAERIIGLALLPVLAFWTVLVAFLGIGISISLVVLRLVGSLFRTEK